MAKKWSPPEHCPDCGHSPVTEVRYGLIRRPSESMRQALKDGSLVLAGCMMPPEPIAYLCRNCGAQKTEEEAGHPQWLALKMARESLKR